MNSHSLAYGQTSEIDPRVGFSNIKSFAILRAGRWVMKVILGSNNFFGVPFPLVLADRFFHIYSSARGFALDIFRWDERVSEAIYEVRASQPQIANITTNPTGIVTFSEPNTGTFLYKFRPKPDISQIFGKVPVNKEFEVRINDHRIEVLCEGIPTCTLERNQFVGLAIGIQIGVDGSIGIGVNRLPQGMVLSRS
jgi:hypothetical protein